LLVVILSYVSLARNMEDREWVTHTYLVLEKLDEVHASAIDAETATRNLPPRSGAFLDRRVSKRARASPDSLHETSQTDGR
jgi:hypothetical protein